MRTEQDINTRIEELEAEIEELEEEFEDLEFETRYGGQHTALLLIGLE